MEAPEVSFLLEGPPVRLTEEGDALTPLLLAVPGGEGVAATRGGSKDRSGRCSLGTVRRNLNCRQRPATSNACARSRGAAATSAAAPIAAARAASSGCSVAGGGVSPPVSSMKSMTTAASLPLTLGNLGRAFSRSAAAMLSRAAAAASCTSASRQRTRASRRLVGVVTRGSRSRGVVSVWKRTAMSSAAWGER